MIFNIKYVTLSSLSIINMCGPSKDPMGWTPEIIEQRKEKTLRRLSIGSTKTFFNNLEKSILEEGFRNPIIVTAGFFSEAYKTVDGDKNFKQFKRRIHPALRDDMENLLTCERVGGSRLYLAQKHGLDIPCIVNDFVGRIEGGQELNTIEEVKDCFQDLPATCFINEAGVMMGGLPHYHMGIK